ncbi:MAG: hypothetical protein JW818_17385 [Pirellulales bacterium]|nr:hypothetical protein [Pirellulales bacterium]
MMLATKDRHPLVRVLDDLAGAVEDLLLTGLTTASQATQKQIDVAFREASRLRLLRLGSTLRIASEELGRFVRKDEDFSRNRLTFFLNRTWLLCQGLARAIKQEDETLLGQLLWVPATQTIDRLEVVTLGVVKRVVKGAFVAFEFRLRTVTDADDVPADSPVTWSCVFPVKPGVDIPPEGFLHLPQKQQFKASLFLEGKTILIEKAALSGNERGSRRVSLLPESTVTAGKPFDDWQRFAAWEPQPALARLNAYEPGPLDLEVDLQEEVVLDDWRIEKAEDDRRELQVVYPVVWRDVPVELVVSARDEAAPARQYLDRAVKQKTRPPLFGLMHFEMCRMLVEPLAVFEASGLKQLHLSDDKVDQKALLQAIRFT